jgi:hypothetical protein
VDDLTGIAEKNTYKYLENNVMACILTLSTIKILIGLFIICFVCFNSYKFGIKQQRFCQSPLLAVLYFSAFANMLFLMFVTITYIPKAYQDKNSIE